MSFLLTETFIENHIFSAYFIQFFLYLYISCALKCCLCHLVRKTKQDISIFEARRQTNVRCLYSLVVTFFNLGRNACLNLANSFDENKHSVDVNWNLDVLTFSNEGDCHFYIILVWYLFFFSCYIFGIERVTVAYPI
jgi:hypothetical protein